MKYIKKPIRACFTKREIKPKSFKLEQFINSDSLIDEDLKKLGISIPLGSSLYLLYCGDDDYIVFTSYYSVEDFIKCNL